MTGEGVPVGMAAGSVYGPVGKGSQDYALGSSGRLAQRESAAFTRLGSSFRNARIHWALGASFVDLRHISDALGSRNYPRVPITGAWLIDCSRSLRLLSSLQSRSPRSGVGYAAAKSNMFDSAAVCGFALRSWSAGSTPKRPNRPTTQVCSSGRQS